MTGEREDFQTSTPGDGAEPQFPPEAGWLEQEPPAVGADFVGRTLAKLRDAGALPREDIHEATSDVHFRGEFLAAHAPPPPAGTFVDRTLQKVQQQRADQWRRLLLRYDAPEPTPDFVARTLVALGDATPSRTLRQRRPAWRTLLVTAAAAAVLVFVLRPQPVPALRAFVAAAESTSAVAQSPAVLSRLVSNLKQTASDGMVPLPPAPDAAALWLDFAEAGR